MDAGSKIERDSQAEGIELADVERLRHMLIEAETGPPPSRRSWNHDIIEHKVAGLPYVPRLGPVAVHIFPNEGSHGRPHFHIFVKGRKIASFSIPDLEMLEGNLSRRSQRAIIEWAQGVLAKLQTSWDLAKAGEKPLIIST